MGLELQSIRRVLEIIQSVFQKFGYQEVESPIFESLELFTRKSGSEIVKQLYSFKDKGGRDLVLRPELTAPVIRLYLQHLRSSPKPLKLCYYGPCFRYEEPQAWRWRQFLQAGAEIIGTQAPEADVEVVLTASEVMRELGFNHWELRVGDVGVLRSALRLSGVGEEFQEPILRAVDSKDPERISEEIRKAGLEESRSRELKKLFSIQGDAKVLDQIPEHLVDPPRVREFNRVLELLTSLGVEFEVDLGIARGLDYYTGLVFEIYAGGVQLAGGGRYDGLVSILGGSPTPATGVGFGVDRIARALLELGVKPESRTPAVMVIPVSQSDSIEAFQLALTLRRAGIPTEIEVALRKLSKALAHADALGVSKVVIVGPEERAEGKILLRDMRTGEQERLSPEELLQRLRSAF